MNEDSPSQGFIVAEKTVLFEVTEFSVIEAIISIISSYYVYNVNYPKYIPAYSSLLFFQEHLLNIPEGINKKPARYRALVNNLKRQTEPNPTATDCH